MSLSPKARLLLPSNVLRESEAEWANNDGELQKLARIELLPELYSVIHRLQSGEIQPKDFDNHLGNVRLKLTSIRQLLLGIEGIEESVEEREEKIEKLRQGNAKRRLFLNQVAQQTKQSSSANDLTGLPSKPTLGDDTEISEPPTANDEADAKSDSDIPMEDV